MVHVRYNGKNVRLTAMLFIIKFIIIIKYVILMVEMTYSWEFLEGPKSSLEKPTGSGHLTSEYSAVSMK